MPKSERTTGYIRTPLGGLKEYWNRKMGIAISYGCNDTIDSICFISCPRYITVNVMNIFNSTPRRKQSHGHR